MRIGRADEGVHNHVLPILAHASTPTTGHCVASGRSLMRRWKVLLQLFLKLKSAASALSNDVSTSTWELRSGEWSVCQSVQHECYDAVPEQVELNSDRVWEVTALSE